MNYHLESLIIPFPIKQVYLGSVTAFNTSLACWKKIMNLQESVKKVSTGSLLIRETASYISSDTIGIDLNMVTHDDRLV